jgi:DNA polymerase III delta prime subunit
MFFLKKYIPKKLDDINHNKPLINNLKKINNENLYNFIIHGYDGLGKTLIKNLYLEQFNKENIRIFNLNLNEDLRKMNVIQDKIENILKISQTKILIIDNIQKLKLKEQYFIKSLIKKKKKLYVFIFLNNIDNLIEHFYSLFIIFELKNINFDIKKKYLQNIFKLENMNISDQTIDQISNKSNNFYDLNKNISLLLNSNVDDIDDILEFNNNDIVIHILDLCLKKKIYDVIDYIDILLNDGYSVNNIINFIINEIINIKDLKYENMIKYIKEIFDNIINTNSNNYTYNQILSLISNLIIKL